MTSSAKHCIYPSHRVRPSSANNPYTLLNWDWKIWGGTSFTLIKEGSLFCLSSCVLSSDTQLAASIVGDLIYKKDTGVVAA